MLTLIKREIYDNMIFFVGAVITEIIIAAYLLIATYFSYVGNNFSIGDIYQLFLSIFFIFSIVVSIELAGLGISQMYIDKNKKISAFLSTLSVTRSRILTARIVAGILAALIFFLPLLIIFLFISDHFGISVKFCRKVFLDVFLSMFFVCQANYFIGLLLGWTSKRIIPIFGGMFLSGIIFTIVIVKGFALYTLLLLILFILASFICIRQKFISTSL